MASLFSNHLSTQIRRVGVDEMGALSKSNKHLDALRSCAARFSHLTRLCINLPVCLSVWFNTIDDRWAEEVEVLNGGSSAKGEGAQTGWGAGLSKEGQRRAPSHK